MEESDECVLMRIAASSCCLSAVEERKMERARRRQARETERQTSVKMFTEMWKLAASRSRHDV